MLIDKSLPVVLPAVDRVIRDRLPWSSTCKVLRHCAPTRAGIISAAEKCIRLVVNDHGNCCVRPAGPNRVTDCSTEAKGLRNPSLVQVGQPVSWIRSSGEKKVGGGRQTENCADDRDNSAPDTPQPPATGRPILPPYEHRVLEVPGSEVGMMAFRDLDRGAHEQFVTCRSDVRLCTAHLPRDFRRRM